MADTLRERSKTDAVAGEGIGVAATRHEERALAALGKLAQAPTYFEAHQSVQYAGVLLSLPALESQGLGVLLDTYDELDGYYGLSHVVLLLSMMALCRIRNPEQLKNHAPGELGKLLGLDRAPEVKCLRKKIKLMVAQQKSGSTQEQLLAYWLGEQWITLFYVDGHARVYHGHKAQLPKRYISRQKLCLAGSMEYWVNDEQGLPLLSVVGELTQKLKEAITEQLLPILLEQTKPLVSEEILAEQPDMPRFTLVFDREAYEPAFFTQLWEDHRVAVITYRKNVTDSWDEECFSDMEVSMIYQTVTMRICEKEVMLSGHSFREIRRLSENGHQTSIITNSKVLDTAQVASKMFSRWNQENYFRYMLQEFDLDRVIEYGHEPENQEKTVVNPPYRKISQQLKKVKEKKARLQAKLYLVIEQHLDKNIDTFAKSLARQAQINEKILQYDQQISQLTQQRSKHPARIAVKDMPEDKRYNRLMKESKLLINIIKMIAYRAETTLLNLLRPHYANNQKDGRTLLKEIFTTPADLYPDYQNNTLTILIHSLSNPRRNKVISELCLLLTDTQTIYPGTDLKMIFKSIAV